MNVSLSQPSSVHELHSQDSSGLEEPVEGSAIKVFSLEFAIGPEQTSCPADQVGGSIDNVQRTTTKIGLEL